MQTGQLATGCPHGERLVATAVGVVVAIAAIVAVVVFVVVATFLFWGRVQKHTSASV